MLLSNDKFYNMKRILYFFLFSLFFASFSSCVMLSSKEYKALIAKNDSLNLGWIDEQNNVADLKQIRTRLERDTVNLNSQIRNLKNDLEKAGSDFTVLKTNSSSEIEKLVADLKRREERLREVEDILERREVSSRLLKGKLENALLGFAKNGLSVELRDGKVYVSLTDKLLFPTASIVLDDKGKQVLAELAEVLKQQPEINIAVEGHTDSQRITNLGQIKDNWDLSVLRATSVVRFLTEVTQIERIRMTATGKGEFQPLTANNTPEERSRNRRIEIVLSPKLDELYELIRK